jgi:hypothetical protein
VFVAPRSGPVYSNVTVTVTFFGASAGIWDFCRYRLVMRGFSSFDLYTNVRFVSLDSVNSIFLLIVSLIVGWFLLATMLQGPGRELLFVGFQGLGYFVRSSTCGLLHGLLGHVYIATSSNTGFVVQGLHDLKFIAPCICQIRRE